MAYCQRPSEPVPMAVNLWSTVGAILPIIAPEHSPESDGFETKHAGHHAVFHMVPEYPHHRKIVRHRHANRGIGVDNYGFERDLCIFCWAKIQTIVNISRQ